MFNWFRTTRPLEALERDLTAVSHSVRALPKPHSAAIKKRVLSRIRESMEQEVVSFEELANELERLTLTIEPTSAFKWKARRNLLDSFTLKTQRVWMGDLFREFMSRRRYGATLVAGLFLFVVTFGYMNQLPTVWAARISAASSVQGVVMVERGADTFPLETGGLVEEGDVIQTDAEGWADIVFVDDSLIMIGPDTRLTVDRLFIDPNNEAKTVIELILTQGRVWANVVNLLPNESSFVMRGGAVELSVPRKATLDLFVLDDRVEARTFSNLVDFSVISGSWSRQGTLGPHLVFDWDGHKTLSIEPLDDLETLKTEDVWVQVNLENEQNHLVNLEQYYQERVLEGAGVLPGDFRYWAKRSLEDVQLFFTFDDDTRSDKAAQLANRRFAEAALLTMQGNDEAAQQAWEDYQTFMVEVAHDYSYDVAESVLESNQKMVDAAGPDSTLSGVRPALEETSVLVAPDEAARTVAQLSTAADRLGLALDLIDIGAYDLALQSLQDYQQGLSDVIDRLPELDMATRKEVILAILDQKLYDLQMLKLISSELAMEVSDTDAVQAEVDAALSDTLYQLNTLVLNLKERAVLHLSTFLKDVKGDKVTQEQILSRLKKDANLDFEFIQLINDVEALYAEEGSDVLILEEGPVTSSASEGFPEDVQGGAVDGTGLPQDQEVRAM